MNTETNPFVSNCDLCLIGGGYAAVNALNSATYHLQKGSRVIVIAKEHGWGGNWINQYNYVRLHQPYQVFTAGKREWDLLKPDTYLADKREILRHLEDIVYKCVEEKELDLLVFFNYLQYDDMEVLNTADNTGKKQVKLKARHLINEKHNNTENVPQFLEIHANRVIKGTGFNILPNKPLNSILTPLSSKDNNNIQSISPSDVLTPEWNVKMRFKTNGANVIPAPIYVIGSGKTAMDVIYHLSKKLKGMKDRICCISGRGTWFVRRDQFNFTSETPFMQKHSYSYNTPLDWIRETFTMYDGTNGLETLKELGKKGFLHTPIPGAASFALGISSTEEINHVKKVLQPSNEKIIRAHLLGLVDNVQTKRTQLKLQTIETREIFYKDLEPGSIIVNCTSHIPNNLKHEPILSHEGMVCSPQYICGFSGPSANWGTHLFYLNKLEPFWRTIPRLSANSTKKDQTGLNLFAMVVLGTGYVTNQIPKEIKDKFDSPALGDLPLHRMLVSGARLGWKMNTFMNNLFTKMITTRYTDANVDNFFVPVYARL